MMQHQHQSIVIWLVICIIIYLVSSVWLGGVEAQPLPSGVHWQQVDTCSGTVVGNNNVKQPYTLQNGEECRICLNKAGNPTSPYNPNSPTACSNQGATYTGPNTFCCLSEKTCVPDEPTVAEQCLQPTTKTFVFGNPDSQCSGLCSSHCHDGLYYCFQRVDGGGNVCACNFGGSQPGCLCGGCADPNQVCVYNPLADAGGIPLYCVTPGCPEQT